MTLEEIHERHIEVRIGGEVVWSRLCESGTITTSSTSIKLEAKAFELPSPYYD